MNSRICGALPSTPPLSNVKTLTAQCIKTLKLKNDEAKGAPQCKLTELNGGKTLRVERSGKLAEKDYREFVAAVKRLIKKHGKIRVLVRHDIDGWTVGALWVDIKFDLKQSGDIERLAIVAKPRWQEGLSKFCKASTSAQIQHFDYSTAGAEQVWFEESSGTQKARQLLASKMNRSPRRPNLKCCACQ